MEVFLQCEQKLAGKNAVSYGWEKWGRAGNLWEEDKVRAQIGVCGGGGDCIEGFKLVI